MSIVCVSVCFLTIVILYKETQFGLLYLYRIQYIHGCINAYIKNIYTFYIAGKTDAIDLYICLDEMEKKIPLCEISQLS